MAPKQKKIPIEKVRYLAFEGGGGKGITFLGAIKALEERREHPILPIGDGEKQHRHIKGISGSSAGAITALFLSLGLTHSDIKNLLTHKQSFIKFFDDPAPGKYRSINSKLVPTVSNTELSQTNTNSNKTSSTLYPIAGLFVANKVDSAITEFLKNNKDSTLNPILSKFVGKTPRYFYNLLFDRGIFPGFEVRNYFSQIVDMQLRTKFKSKLKNAGIDESDKNIGGKINFRQFSEITGVDLRVTGVNVTQKKPLYFDKFKTRDFPVVEAICISMNLPFLFKAIYFDAPDNEKYKNYKGYWVDGGVLNNLPIHAFDYTSVASENDSSLIVDKTDPDLRRLNKNVVAFRLISGFKESQKNKPDNSTKSIFDSLQKHLGDFTSSLLYPSDQGQLRTPAEEDQTIPLYTGDLETIDFSPVDNKSRYAINNAEIDVIEYFSK